MLEPQLVKNFLFIEEFEKLQKYVKSLPKDKKFLDPMLNSYSFNGGDELFPLHNKLVATAREKFANQNLIPSYSWIIWYFGDAALEKHKDINPCTYSIDLCVYQKTPWDLYVEGVPYTLMENDALFYCGEDQQHWREKFPDPDNNVVCNVLFFFIEPDHWSRTIPLDKQREFKANLVKERNPHLYIGFDK